MKSNAPHPPPEVSAPWVSVGVPLVGILFTFGLTATLAEGHPLRETLLRSPVSQLCTVGLFWWGATQLWLRRSSARAEQDKVERLAHHMSPERVTAIIQDELCGEGIPYDELHALFKPYQGTLAGSLGWSALRSLYLDAHSGVIQYERLVQSVDRSYQQCYERVEGEYRGVTAVMWLMPLSGFLGTVIGMSGAIASFDTVIASAGVDLKSLAPAVSGLATAFDTTLVALALVVPLKLAEVLSERRDQALLDLADQTLGVGLLDRIDLSALDQLALARKRREESPHEEALSHLSALRDKTDEAGLALAQLTAQLSALADQLQVPLHTLSDQLNARSLDSTQVTEALQEASRQLSDTLTAQLATHEARRAQSAQRLEEALHILIEQNERPLVLSRGAGK